MADKLNIDKLSEIIKKQIISYKEDIKLDSIGQVISIGDGIALAYGLEKAMLGELVVFKSKATGLVIDLDENIVGIIILDGIDTIKQGDSVKATGRVFSVPVGDDFLGRVVDPLLKPIDGGAIIKSKKQYPIERRAYGVIERGKVNTPLQTGIMMIDALIPIGRGQRELIIGDRKTGKTTIAIDTIINQKDKNVKCIYCAIGQKESSIASLRNLLFEKGALSYTTIVSASASKPSTMLYLAPYSAVALAEYFMEKGDDVLIVYDDLSKHASAYRELSLLLKRPPGREAYPGDVFYLHSRLLERSAKLSKELGGGSITALPIIETQAGDISAYIPTNVISITDGQIFLENELFYSGIRPAINSGLSVSRVGGSAQIKAIKKVSGTLRISLASFRELESFAQFGSDLDQKSQERLDRGRRTVEILKQDVHILKSVEYQAVILYALNKGILDRISLSKVSDYANFIEEKLKISDTGILISKSVREKGELPSEEILNNFFLEIDKIFIK